jgi:hypothetical protein
MHVNTDFGVCVQTVLGVAAALGPASVNLRTAANYVILAETGITTVPPSVISPSPHLKRNHLASRGCLPRED